MKNVNSLKSTGKSGSPKTPGGISKSLLTPCRRVGLSRSWRKSGPSPFISPLSNSQTNTNETQRENVPRKRKKDSPEKGLDNEEYDSTAETSTSIKKSSSDTEENCTTPTRANSIRKRCKTLNLTKELQESECPTENTHCKEDLENDNIENSNTNIKISKLSRRSKSIINKNKLSKKHGTDKGNNSKQSPAIETNLHEKELQSNENVNTKQQQEQTAKSNSPPKLTSECIVVIQKEIINKADHDGQEKNEVERTCPKPSQALFDSDSDDVPLCQVNKKPNNDISVKTQSKTDLSGRKQENNVAKLEDKKTSTTDLKVVLKKSKLSRKNSNKEKITQIESKPSSQSSNSFEDDDDDFDHKRTIIIKKSYDKITKPLKAKSTGSITDKDIEELKARIEAKKKLLMVKALGNDTEDLRELIKKWQKGCQDALVELMELMKKKMPEQPKMENTQILQMLKIPPDLVGYDSENDRFNSPNDTNIILSSLKI